MHRLDTVYKSKQTHLQLGDNKNLVDWVYVGNVAKAHLLATDRLSREDVAGQVFFITNGEPIPSFDFSRAAWKELGDDLSRPVIKIPRMFAIYLAFFSELWCRIVGGKTEFTRFNVRYVTAAQWYNIDKVRYSFFFTERCLTYLGSASSWIWTRCDYSRWHQADGQGNLIYDSPVPFLISYLSVVERWGSKKMIIYRYRRSD